MQYFYYFTPSLEHVSKYDGETKVLLSIIDEKYDVKYSENFYGEHEISLAVQIMSGDTKKYALLNVKNEIEKFQKLSMIRMGYGNPIYNAYFDW